MSGKDCYIIAFDFTEFLAALTGQEKAEVLDSWSLRAIEEQNIFIEEKEEAESRLRDPKAIEHHSKSDYRFSAIRVTTVDCTQNMKKSSTEPLRAKFMGYGVVRLYKEYDNTKESEEIEVESDETTVAIVAVPNYFSATDLLVFLGDSVTKNVSHFRLIKSDNPNRFMVLIKFRNNESARTFQECFNGKYFNSMESETCHVIFVKSVIFKPLNSKNLQAGIPYLLEDPFTLQMRKSHQDTSGALESAVVKELPSCPVCLERMDSDATGLLTISCQHTFHCNCLSKWRDDTCPVCRYSNLSTNPLALRDASNSQDSCSICGGDQNLWICLICGNIGCGRYNSKHAIQHYEKTNHCFAMDIATQRVWDYAGDNYVHRLIQNETDGKLVELPANSTTCSPSPHEKDKNRDYAFEYSNVLLSQLESQRDYYESRLAESADAFNYTRKENEEMNSRLKAFENQLQEVTKTFDKIQLESNSKKDSMDEKVKQADQLKKLAQAFEKKWKDEQAITKGLAENLAKVKEQNQSLKLQTEELQSQVTDLMFYLESQDKFKDASDDVRNGTILVQERSSRPKTRRTR